MKHIKGIRRIGVILLLLGVLVVGVGFYYFKIVGSEFDKRKQDEIEKNKILLNIADNDILLFDKIWGSAPCPPSLYNQNCVTNGKTELYNSGKFLLRKGDDKYTGQISQERINSFIQKIKETGILKKNCSSELLMDYWADYVINVDGKKKKITSSGCEQELREIEENLNISASDYYK